MKEFNKVLYKEEMKKAKKIFKNSADIDAYEYWYGYIRGLEQRRRNDLIYKYDHTLWMEMYKSQDESKRNKAWGYINGYYGPAILTTRYPVLIKKYSVPIYGVPIFISPEKKKIEYSEGFKIFRKWWGITQSELANICSVTKKAVQSWEYKVCEPKKEKLFLLLNYIKKL